MRSTNNRILGALGITLALGAFNVQAGLGDSLQGALKTIGGSDAVRQATTGALSESEMVDGLKEALAQGVQSAIESLGRTDGFLADELVRIPVPEGMGMAEQAARKLGQGQYVDQFIETMNRAAEQATPEAAQILGDAIRAMSVEDAAQIINGPEDAATQYFRRVSGASLAERFLPIVKGATDGSGVAAAYKKVAEYGGNVLGNLASGAGLPGLGGAAQAPDLDQYVTDKALDGLFTYIALEERQIRENPLARSTDLLKRVFGD